MCGIAGWIDQNRDLRAQTEIVERMGATLASRGPDDAGTWISSRAAFAHRRLIVIDPRGGAQPMVRRRGKHEFVITYNGELYNTDELRQELIACGQVFSSRSDTEVLLRSYMQWGKDCLEKLNGIFAFAVWDDCNKTLFMARDRLGVKPLVLPAPGGQFSIRLGTESPAGQSPGGAPLRCGRVGRSADYGTCPHPRARSFQRGAGAKARLLAGLSRAKS